MDENALLTAFLMLLYLMYLDKKVCRVVQTILGLFLLTVVRIMCVCLLLTKWISRFRKCLLPRFPKPCPRVIAYPAWAARVAREKARDNARAVAVI